MEDGARAWKRSGLALVALLVVVGCALGVRALVPGDSGSADGRVAVLRLSGLAFGTTWKVAVVGEADAVALQVAIEDELRRLNGIFSTYDPESELSIFNAAGTKPGDELRSLVVLAVEVAEASGGAFDPTVGPLVRRWGFGRDGHQAQAPDAEELAALRQRVGYRHLLLQDGTLARARPDVELDLAAIAKGYAVDQVLALLVARGHRDAFVEIGGEISCRGTNPAGAPWKVGVQEPRVGSAPQARLVIPVTDRAVATSGEYRNRYELGGEPVSHTVDPRTGRPIHHDLVSVTVVAESCARADAWATALNVLGPIEGPALAERLDLAVLFMRLVDDVVQERSTPAFRRLLEEGP